VAPEIEAAALALAIEQPAWGPIRAANELAKRGLHVSPSGVRAVWVRHDLGTMKLRLRALSARVAQEGLILTEAQVAALELAKEEQEAFGEIESEHPGYLGAQDTYYVGTIKGIGRIYQQTFIDTYSRVAFAKVYDRRNALVAADLLNDRVVPWFEEQGVRLLRILTDRGTEYCGARERHEYQVYLAIEDIDHTRTRVRRSQRNGICERFHKTVKDEFYSIAFRKRLYASLEELQADLDGWLAYSNAQRPHSGKYCYGKTPLQTFEDAKSLAQEKQLDALHRTPDVPDTTQRLSDQI